jgi:CheY-like chemotaxis protein
MNGERILIVDDDPMSVKLVRALLTGEGHIVRSAKSAEEALTVLNTFDPRLILIDIQLPEVDGLELTRRLRSNPSMQKISIVALTAFAMQGNEQKARSAGCDGYITKPIDVRTLASTVGRFLKEHGRQDVLPSGGALTNSGQGPLADASRSAPTIESAEPFPSIRLFAGGATGREQPQPAARGCSGTRLGAGTIRLRFARAAISVARKANGRPATRIVIRVARSSGWCATGAANASSNARH